MRCCISAISAFLSTNSVLYGTVDFCLLIEATFDLNIGRYIQGVNIPGSYNKTIIFFHFVFLTEVLPVEKLAWK